MTLVWLISMKLNWSILGILVKFASEWLKLELECSQLYRSSFMAPANMKVNKVGILSQQPPWL
jgi:hypothetical protein